MSQIQFEVAKERAKEVEEALEIEYEILKFNEIFAKEKKDDEYWATAVIETKERIEEIKNDFLNYVEGGEGYISGHLEAIREIEKNQQNEKAKSEN